MSDILNRLRMNVAAREPHWPVMQTAANEIEHLQTELARANRIARAADRMFDAIRARQTLAAILHPSIIAAADAYESSMSDPEAEATDRG